MNQIIFGVDPGLSGAVAILDSHGSLVGIHDMPTMAKGTGKKKQVNPAALTGFLAGYSGCGGATAYLERVSAMPGQGVSSVFAFGESYGVIRGVLAAAYIPLELVTPQAWKRRFGLLGTEKDAARTKAIELYPEASLARKKDIGRADALLIARYGWEMEQKRVAA